MIENILEIKPKKLRGEDGHRTISLRLPNDMYDEIEKISQKTGHKKNSIIRMLLKYALKNYAITVDE